VALRLLLALFALCLWGVIRNRVFGFLGLSFFMLLAPSSSLVPIPLEPMAEHRMYLPLAILGAGLVALSWALIGRIGALREDSARAAKLLLASCALLGVVLGARTFARNRDYASDLALWKDTAEKRPGSARALTNHGLALAASGDLDGAIERQREALRARPQYSEAHHNLASALMLRSQFTEAEASYREAIELSPDAVESRVGLGEALVRSSRFDEAAVEFEAALRLRSDLYGAQRSLAAIRLQQERLDESAAHFIAALRLDGSDPQLWNLLGTIYARQGKYDLAGEQFRAALRVRPDFPDARANLQRLAEMGSSMGK
jgi:tetratricopeptide (TPR) repeat protein